MTTFAPTFSPRWKGTYVAAGIEHTIQVRAGRGSSFSDMNAFAGIVNTVWNAMISVLASDFAWVQAEIALTDSDVFIPATTPSPLDDPGGADPSLFSPQARAYGLTFTGKSASARARFTLFGILLPTQAAAAIGGDGLITPAEVAAVSTVVGIASTSFRAADGSTAAFHNRGTYKCNDHLLKLIRRGTIS